MRRSVRRYSLRILLMAVFGVLYAALPDRAENAAKEAAPQSERALAELGLPPLDLTATVEGIEGFPEALDAGRYLITLTVAEGLELGGGFDLVQPLGMTADAFIVLLNLPGEEEVGDLPPELSEATWAGGIYADDGATSQVVLDLTPGEWIVSSDDGTEPVVVEATGVMPTDLPEPKSSATITMDEDRIEVTEGELTAGSHIIRIDNTGAQPYGMMWVQGPDSLTEEQIELILREEREAERTGTPVVYSDVNPEEDVVDMTVTGIQSPGTSMWIRVDGIAAGTHVLIRRPDVLNDMTSAFQGMHTIVDVSE